MVFGNDARGETYSALSNWSAIVAAVNGQSSLWWTRVSGLIVVGCCVRGTVWAGLGESWLRCGEGDQMGRPWEGLISVYIYTLSQHIYTLGKLA